MIIPVCGWRCVNDYRGRTFRRKFLPRFCAAHAAQSNLARQSSGKNLAAHNLRRALTVFCLVLGLAFGLVLGLALCKINIQQAVGQLNPHLLFLMINLFVY